MEPSGAMGRAKGESEAVVGFGLGSPGLGPWRAHWRG